MRHDRRTFLRAIGAGSVAGGLAALSSGSAAGQQVGGGSPFDGDDGFADTAPWLDGETDVDVHRVTEPTREQIEAAVTASGPRVVVFETSGTIDLEGEALNVTEDECWIAGQTAPSPGITFIRGEVSIQADDCVVQHVRCRAGDAGMPDGEWQPDSLNVGEDAQNNVIDHCTATWSVDECLSVGYYSTDSTVTNCLIAEALADATHPKGPHPYGTLVGNDATGVTLAGNAWVDNLDRHPRLKTGTESVVVNNLVVNYKDAVWMDSDAVTSVEGNVYRNRNSGTEVVFGTGSAHVADNVTPDREQMVSDRIDRLDSRPHWPDGLAARPSDETEDIVLAYAGARPADRTEHDRRIVENLRNGGGGRIDSQEDVGGYPDLAVNTHSLTVPDSGLREWLEGWALAVEEPGVSPPDGSGDTTPPDAPTGLVVRDTTLSTAELSWNETRDADGSMIVGYHLYLDGQMERVVDVGFPETTVTGLDADATYEVAVTAVDGADNESAPATATVTTGAVPDGVEDHQFEAAVEGGGSYQDQQASITVGDGERPRVQIDGRVVASATNYTAALGSLSFDGETLRIGVETVPTAPGGGDALTAIDFESQFDLASRPSRVVVERGDCGDDSPCDWQTTWEDGSAPEATIAPALSVEEVGPDGVVEAAVTMSSVPEGLSGYDLTVAVSDPSVAAIEDATYPDSLFEQGSEVAEDGSSASLQAVDAGDAIRPGDGETELATVSLRARSAGETDVSVTVEALDDESGDPLAAATTTDALTVRDVAPVDGTVPQDIDGDGKHEDFNDNDRLDSDDVVVYFNNYDDPAVTNHSDAYDFNHSGDVDFDDIVQLFGEL